jgi:uncharacterized protein (DUF2344 family)
MENVIVPEKIHLIQVNWIRENTALLEEKLTYNPTYDFQVAHNMMHNLEKEIVKIRLYVDMSGKINGKTINQGGNYEVDFLFKIDDLNDQYKLEEEKPIFNGAFVATLLGISYSTVRGMLLTIWKDTMLKSLILPVISVPELLKSKR